MNARHPVKHPTIPREDFESKTDQRRKLADCKHGRIERIDLQVSQALPDGCYNLWHNWVQVSQPSLIGEVVSYSGEVSLDQATVDKIEVVGENSQLSCLGYDFAIVRDAQLRFLTAPRQC